MSIILVGLNYRTAPIELREKLILSVSALKSTFADMLSEAQVDVDSTTASLLIDEVVILSTCNRLEVYACTEHSSEGIALITQLLAALQNSPVKALEIHLYRRVGDDAIKHLMGVACGLDSMMLGESQILGQVSHAYEEAHRAGTTGAVLSHLFAQAIRCGKRARTETPISRYTTSVSHAAAMLLMQKHESHHPLCVLVVGAGEMAVLAAQALQRIERLDLIFLNRTYTHAETLAKDFGGKAFAWDQLDEALAWADAVVCATGAPYIVVDRHTVETVLLQRTNRPLVLIDIAVPRDVEDSVGELPGVEVYDIDDLQVVVDTNLELRKAAVPQVEAIIGQEMARFAEWFHGRQVVPVIKTLREWAQSIAQDELVQTLNRLADADERTREVVSRMAHRLVNRLLHEPTSRLRIQASEGNGQGYAHAVRELFALNTLETAACQQHEASCGGMGQGNPLGECNLRCILPATTDP